MRAFAVSGQNGTVIKIGLNGTQQTAANASGTAYTSLSNSYKGINMQTFAIHNGNAGVTNRTMTLTINNLQPSQAYLVQLGPMVLVS